MKILSSYSNGKLILYLHGELDHHEAKDTLKLMEESIDQYMPRDCVLELGGMTFMDSSGIAVILKTYKKMNETGGRAWIENAKGQPLKVIDASGIDRIVKVTIPKETQK